MLVKLETSNLKRGFMFVLLVQFVVKPAMQEQVKSYLRKMEEHSRKEPGCRLYIASQSNENTRKVCIYEAYDDVAARDAHRAAPYFAEYVTNGFVPLTESITRETFTTISS